MDGWGDVSCAVPVENLSSNGGVPVTFDLPGRSWKYFLVTVGGGKCQNDQSVWRAASCAGVTVAAVRTAKPSSAPCR